MKIFHASFGIKQYGGLLAGYYVEILAKTEDQAISLMDAAFSLWDDIHDDDREWWNYVVKNQLEKLGTLGHE